VEKNICNEFIRLNNKGKSLIQSYYENMNNKSSETRRLYSNIMKIFQSHINYRREKENSRIQKMVLAATVISVLVAIISLFIVISSNIYSLENMKVLWEFIFDKVSVLY